MAPEPMRSIPAPNQPWQHQRLGGWYWTCPLTCPTSGSGPSREVAREMLAAHLEDTHALRLEPESPEEAAAHHRRQLTAGLVGPHLDLYRNSARFAHLIDLAVPLVQRFLDVLADDVRKADADHEMAVEAMRRLPTPTVWFPDVGKGTQWDQALVDQSARTQRLIVECDGHDDVDCRIRHAVYLTGGPPPCSGCSCRCHQPHDWAAHESMRQPPGPGPCQVCGAPLDSHLPPVPTADRYGPVHSFPDCARRHRNPRAAISENACGDGPGLTCRCRCHVRPHEFVVDVQLADRCTVCEGRFPMDDPIHLHRYEVDTDGVPCCGLSVSHPVHLVADPPPAIGPHPYSPTIDGDGTEPCLAMVHGAGLVSRCGTAAGHPIHLHHRDEEPPTP